MGKMGCQNSKTPESTATKFGVDDYISNISTLLQWGYTGEILHYCYVVFVFIFCDPILANIP